jgi:hypothetical protein
MAESKLDEQGRLRRRTDELPREHVALDREISPFNQADHDEHTEHLRPHKSDLATRRIDPSTPVHARLAQSGDR